jgi:hypothetical protein
MPASLKAFQSVLCSVIFAATATATAAQSPAQTPPLPPEQLATYRMHCGEDIASIGLDEVDGARLSFDTRGKLVTIGICVDQFQIGAAYEVENVAEALTFMAWRDAEPLWPLAEAKWGNDLGKLRADLRELAISAPGSTEFGLLLNKRTDLVRSTAFSLSRLGYDEEALALLDEEIARLTDKPGKRRRKFDFERVMAAIAYASITSQDKGDSAGAQWLGAHIASMPADHEHRLNAEINRAAFLAESGQYQAAIDLLAPAYVQFIAAQDNGKQYKIGGSDREFAWILACAYHGIGSAEAGPYIRIVNSAEEEPQDQYLGSTKRSSTIKLRMAACMNDQDAYFATMFSEGFGALSGIWSEVQSPQKSSYFFFRPEWTFPATVQDQYLERYRILPDSYASALARWQPVGRPVGRFREPTE